MNRGRHRFPFALAALVTISSAWLIFTNGSIWAQQTRAIRVVVPFPPGGAMDFLARVFAEQIDRAHGPAMVIENRPGAGTVIATEAVSRAAPDGNALLMPANSFVINPLLHKLNYDPLTDFEPICYLARSPTVIVVGNSSPYATLTDLLHAAIGRPGELTIAAVGPATSFHIAIEVFKRLAGADLTYVPYPGGAPAITALLGEHVTSAFSNYIEVAEHLKSGKLRALAAASLKRVDMLPDVPTITESGYQNFQFGELVFSGSLGENATPDRLQPDRIVYRRACGARPQSQAGITGFGSCRHLRQGFRRLHPQTI